MPSRIVRRLLHAVAIAALGGCGAGTMDAHISITASVAGNTINVTGTTNLPDGSILLVYVVHEVEQLPFDAERSVAVVDGRFEVQVDTIGWPAGAARASAWFGMDPPGQPANVVQLVGPRGERIRGDQTHENEFGSRSVTSN